MDESNEERLVNSVICEQSTRHWITSGRLLSPWHDGNNNKAKRMLRRRLSFNGDRMANLNRQVLNVYEDETDIDSTKSELKTEEVKWSTELEQDLGYLWDMTAEKDVVSFLIDKHFLSIGQYVLNISTEERLTEIIVGIIGNLCCQSDGLVKVSEKTELVDSLLNLLSCDDTETLIQVLRILQAAIWDIHREKSSSKWLRSLKNGKFLGNSLTFILQSSTNENLLIPTLDFLQSITYVEIDNYILFKDIFDMKSLLSAIIETFSELIPNESNEEIPSSKEMKIIENWLEILSKILQISSENIHDVIEDDKAVVNVLKRILVPYNVPENLKMSAMEEPRIVDCIHQTIVDCIHQTIELISWFQQNGFNVDVTVVSVVLEIMYQLHNLTSSNFNGAEENLRVKDLQKFLEAYWLKLQSTEALNTITELLQLSPAATKHYLTHKFFTNITTDE